MKGDMHKVIKIHVLQQPPPLTEKSIDYLVVGAIISSIALLRDAMTEKSFLLRPIPTC